MNKEKLQKFKSVLLEQRADVLSEIKRIEKNDLNKSQREASGDLSGYSFHLADAATDDLDRRISFEMVSNEQQILALIERALDRIEKGIYGICETCGKEINLRRLEAIPYTTQCKKCRQKEERG